MTERGCSDYYYHNYNQVGISQFPRFIMQAPGLGIAEETKPKFIQISIWPTLSHASRTINFVKFRFISFDCLICAWQVQNNFHQKQKHDFWFSTPSQIWCLLFWERIAHPMKMQQLLHKTLNLSVSSESHDLLIHKLPESISSKRDKVWMNDQT